MADDFHSELPLPLKLTNFDEVQTLHRRLMEWVIKTKYQLSESETGRIYALRNRSNVIGGGFGLMTYISTRRLAHRVSIRFPQYKNQCDLYSRFAAIPSLLLYVRVFQGQQAVMLPAFYTDLIAQEDKSAFGNKAVEILREIRGAGSEARITAMVHTPAPSSGSIDAHDDGSSISGFSSSSGSSSVQAIADPWASPVEPRRSPYANVGESTESMHPSANWIPEGVNEPAPSFGNNEENNQQDIFASDWSGDNSSKYPATKRRSWDDIRRENQER